MAWLWEISTEVWGLLCIYWWLEVEWSVLEPSAHLWHKEQQTGSCSLFKPPNNVSGKQRCLYYYQRPLLLPSIASFSFGTPPSISFSPVTASAAEKPIWDTTKQRQCHVTSYQYCCPISYIDIIAAIVHVRTLHVSMMAMSDITAGRRTICQSCWYVSTMPWLVSSTPWFSCFSSATSDVVTRKTMPQKNRKPNDPHYFYCM